MELEPAVLTSSHFLKSGEWVLSIELSELESASAPLEIMEMRFSCTALTSWPVLHQNTCTLGTQCLKNISSLSDRYDNKSFGVSLEIWAFHFSPVYSKRAYRNDWQTSTGSSLIHFGIITVMFASFVIMLRNRTLKPNKLTQREGGIVELTNRKQVLRYGWWFAFVAFGTGSSASIQG